MMAAPAVQALALLMVAALGGCAEDAGRVANRFVDRYFVELDQARARELSVGLAARKLDEELRLVEGVRRTMRAETARPTVSYARRSLRVDGDHGRAVFDLVVRYGGDETKRELLVSLERQGERWRVGNFIVNDGPPATAPAGAPPATGR